MREFNYSNIREQKWDSNILGYIGAIYKEAGKQEQYLKQRPEELEKLMEIAKVQSTRASNAIEGIVTTHTRMKWLVEEKTTPKTRDEQEIAGYRDGHTEVLFVPLSPFETPDALDRICEEYHRGIKNMEVDPLLAINGEVMSMCEYAIFTK